MIYDVKRNILYIFLICMMLSMSGCSLFNRISSENMHLKEYSLSYTELQLADNKYGTCYVKQISMTNEDSGWLLTNENELYHTSNGISEFQKVNEFRTVTPSCDSHVHGCFLNSTCAYVAYSSDDSIVIESTMSSGNVWTQTHIPYTEYMTPASNSIFLSFMDSAHGYLLYCSDSASGQMKKFLFQTQDGGKTFHLVSDLTGSISGYPTGIAFSSFEQGFITVTYHGQEDYLFQSTDGGVSWESVSLVPYTETALFSYINAYPPVFFGDTRTSGVLLLQYISENPCYAIYRTTDGGMTWKPKGIFHGDSMQSYSFSNDDEGFFVDYTGTLFTLSCAASSR